MSNVKSISRIRQYSIKWQKKIKLKIPHISGTLILNVIKDCLIILQDLQLKKNMNMTGNMTC